MTKKKQSEPVNGDETQEARRKIKRLLKVALTPEEERFFGKESARYRQELALANDQLDEIKGQFKGKIEGYEKEQNRIMVLLNNGYEYRDVECEIIEDFKALTIQVTRLDTGEVVEDRPMNEAERQQNLPMEAAAG